METRLAFLLLMLALGFGATGEPLDVLCSTTIVGDVVRAVAGADAVVAVLFPPGLDPHAFQPATQDAIAFEAADVVFLSGAGLESGLGPLLAAARGRVVDLSAGLRLRAHDDDDGETAHSFADPHVWFDPWNVIEWVHVIAQTLGEADPEKADAFAGRGASYSAELVSLDAWIQGRVAALPPSSRQLVTDHEAFGYFADHYGFAAIGTVFPGTSTLAEPSARNLALLEEAIRASGVPAVFVGTTVSATLAEQVAADTGVRIVFLYTGSLGEPGGPAATYLDFMRFDVDQIVSALTP
jgi:manganese/iron transport system substrate-binding protein